MTNANYLNQPDQIVVTKISKPEVLKRCALALMQAYNGEPWNDKWTVEKALEKLQCFYDSPKFHGFYLTQNGQVVGACFGNIEPYFEGDYFYLKEMFIAPLDQRKGFGNMLITDLKKFLTSIDINTIILFTSDKGAPFDFYIKNKFEKLDGMCMMTAKTN
jgi:aminoglycoside 6'-N-acetyltransferase I